MLFDKLRRHQFRFQVHRGKKVALQIIVMYLKPTGKYKTIPLTVHEKSLVRILHIQLSGTTPKGNRIIKATVGIENKKPLGEDKKIVASLIVFQTSHHIDIQNTLVIDLQGYIENSIQYLSQIQSS